MKKIMMILACVLVCFSLFTGCTNQKGNDDQDTNLGNSVEIDDTDIEIDTEPGLDTEDNSDKLIRSQGGIAGVTSQGMADMMALDGGKYGKGILDSCRVKFIMQMEEQEARLVQEKLALTEEETRMITRFRRGEGLLCIGHNHVLIAIHVSPKEYEAITTSPTDLRARLRQDE